MKDIITWLENTNFYRDFAIDLPAPFNNSSLLVVGLFILIVLAVLFVFWVMYKISSSIKNTKYRRALEEKHLQMEEARLRHEQTLMNLEKSEILKQLEIQRQYNEQIESIKSQQRIADLQADIAARKKFTNDKHDYIECDAVDCDTESENEYYGDTFSGDTQTEFFKKFMQDIFNSFTSAADKSDMDNMKNMSFEQFFISYMKYQVAQKTTAYIGTSAETETKSSSPIALIGQAILQQSQQYTNDENDGILLLTGTVETEQQSQQSQQELDDFAQLMKQIESDEKLIALVKKSKADADAKIAENLKKFEQTETVNKTTETKKISIDDIDDIEKRKEKARQEMEKANKKGFFSRKKG